MRVSATVGGRVRILSLGPDGLKPHMPTKSNRIVNDGLNAWTYNLVKTDGSVIASLGVGTGTTAPAVTDSALVTEVGRFELFTTYNDEWYFIIPPNVIANNDIRELGLFFGPSSVSTTDQKMFARITIASEYLDMQPDHAAIVVWGVGLERPSGPPAAQEFKENASDYIMSRVRDLTEYSVWDTIHIGTSNSANDNSGTDLEANVGSETIDTIGFTGGNQVNISGTLTYSGSTNSCREIGVGTSSVVYIRAVSATIFSTLFNGTDYDYTFDIDMDEHT
jgi:hypothetical protein